MDENESPLAVDEFVEYCRTQIGLLSGTIERIGTEADDLLNELDEETTEIRTHLEGQTDSIERTTAPPSANTPSDSEVDVAAVEDLERDLEEKQTLLKAKHARMEAFQELAAGYTDLIEELRSDVDSGREAMQRVVRFEATHDAPAYFEDRQTVYEAAVSSRGSDG